MRKYARWGWLVIAMALVWLSLIPGRVAANWTPLGCTPPVGGFVPYGIPGMMMPQQPQPQIYRAPAAQPQASMQPQPTQWQQAPPPPSVVRGVAATAPPKFVLPRPEALGVATSVNMPVAAPVQVDWNQIQSRLARLNVMEYHKVASPAGGIQVTLVLPQQQRVNASGETEAAAIMSALQQAETQRRP